MNGLVSFYNSDEHTIIKGELAAFCERLVSSDHRHKGKLFVVRYNKLGSFVIAEWLTKPMDVFVDVMNLGKSLSNFTREKAHELRHRLFSPITAEETSRFIQRGDSDYHHMRQDENEEEQERWDKCAIGE
jgi:hypothetical protein